MQSLKESLLAVLQTRGVGVTYFTPSYQLAISVSFYNLLIAVPHSLPFINGYTEPIDE